MNQQTKVICFGFDLFGHTQASLRMDKIIFSIYNESLLNFINPYLKEFELTHCALKFTGDGWYIWEENLNNGHAVLAFAKTIASKFQTDFSKILNKPEGEVSPLRLAICEGLDTISVSASGQKEYLGDSTRIVSRILQCCAHNELLVDYSIFQFVRRCFEFTKVDINSLPENRFPEKWEEEIPIYSVGELIKDFSQNLPRVRPRTDLLPYITYLKLIGESRDATHNFSTVRDAIVSESNFANARGARTPNQIGVWSEIGSQLKQALLRAPTPDSRDDLIRLMVRIGVPPTLPVFTSLINRASTYTESLDWFNRMDGAGLSPDIFIYNTIINRSPDLETATRWLDKMIEMEVIPSDITYNTLINRSPDLHTAIQWFDRMRNDGIKTNVITYNTLINHCSDLDVATQWLEKMCNVGIGPNAITASTLIEHCRDFHSAVKCFDKMADLKVVPNTATYNTLIDHCPDFETTIQWFETMIEHHLLPDVYTYNILIDHCPDIALASLWFERMCGAGIAPDAITYNTLIDHCPNVETGMGWFEQMVEARIPPDSYTYSILIKLSPDLDTGKKWLKEMTAVGIARTTATYTNLINLCPDLETGIAQFYEMIQQGIAPSEITATSLAKKIASSSDADKLLDELRKNNVRTAGRFYSQIFTILPRFVGAETLLSWSRRQDFHYPASITKAIAAYRNLDRLDDACRVALTYPYLDDSRRLFRECEKVCIAYYDGLLQIKFQTENAYYALGYCYFDNDKQQYAYDMFEQALYRTTQEKRARDINQRIEEIYQLMRL